MWHQPASICKWHSPQSWGAHPPIPVKALLDARYFWKLCQTPADGLKPSYPITSTPCWKSVIALESANLWYYLCRELPALLSIAGVCLGWQRWCTGKFWMPSYQGWQPSVKRHENQQFLTPKTRSHHLPHKQDKAPKAIADRPWVLCSLHEDNSFTSHLTPWSSVAWLQRHFCPGQSKLWQAFALYIYRS